MGDTILTQEALAHMQTDGLGQFLLDNSKFLEELYHKLKGESLTEEVQEVNGEKVLVPVWKNILNIKPVINELGLNFTMNVLNLMLTANNATGNMDSDTLRILAYEMYTEIIKNYRMNLENYGFESEAKAYILAKLLHNNIQLHLSKSTNMGLLKELFSNYYIQETRGTPEKPRQETNMTL